MDRSRRWSAVAIAFFAEAAQDMEELQAQDLHGGTEGGQFHPDREGLEDVPLSFKVLLEFAVECDVLINQPAAMFSGQRNFFFFFFFIFNLNLDSLFLIAINFCM